VQQLPEHETEREIELKLEGSARDLARVRLHPMLERLAESRPRVRQLHSVYFDTAELALFQHGVVLRVRSDGRERVQTVKTRGRELAGLFERPEYEAPTSSDQPDLDLVPDPALREWLRGETEGRGSELVPVVETRIARTTHLLAAGPGQVELAIDEGEMRTAEGALPIHEVELELVEGEPRLLYTLALELQEGLGLRPSLVAKPERGFAKLLKRGPEPVRARKLELDDGARCEELVAALWGECLRQVVGNQAAVEAGEAEGVHQMRVGARRLRAALGLLRRALPRAARGLGDELRWLGRQLGAAREWDVFLGETLRPVLRARPDDAALDRLRGLAETERARAYGSLRETLRTPRYARLGLHLGEWRVTERWRTEAADPALLQRPAQEVARELLEPLERKLRRRCEQIGQADPGKLHALRLQVKKVRYATEFVEPLFPGKKARRFARRLARVQDTLGQLNDVATAERLVDTLLAAAPADVALARAAGFVLGSVDRAVQEQLADLPRRLRKLSGAEPFWD
jgi:inorganic triphosphatase YgiF